MRYPSLFAPSDSSSRNRTRESLPHSLGLCLGSLAASGPAKVVGLDNTTTWIANGPTDFGGPAADGEATEATATGKAPGIGEPPNSVPAKPDHRVAENKRSSHVVKPIPAKPDHRLTNCRQTLKTKTRTAINDQTISNTWLV